MNVFSTTNKVTNSGQTGCTPPFCIWYPHFNINHFWSFVHRLVSYNLPDHLLLPYIKLQVAKTCYLQLTLTFLCGKHCQLLHIASLLPRNNYHELEQVTIEPFEQGKVTDVVCRIVWACRFRCPFLLLSLTSPPPRALKLRVLTYMIYLL